MIRKKADLCGKVRFVSSCMDFIVNVNPFLLAGRAGQDLGPPFLALLLQLWPDEDICERLAGWQPVRQVLPLDETHHLDDAGTNHMHYQLGHCRKGGQKSVGLFEYGEWP